jgi:hypothetical protein
MFLPWVAWSGIFAAIFLIIMAIFGWGRYIYRFTRMSGETFGTLIGAWLKHDLDFQQCIHGDFKSTTFLSNTFFAVVQSSV